MFLLLAVAAAAEQMQQAAAVLVATSINKVFQSLVRLRSPLVPVESVDGTAQAQQQRMVQTQCLVRSPQ
jgi:hypothetical protein